MMQEIQEELQLNIALLQTCIKVSYDVLDKQQIPLEMTRVRLAALQYAISSGEIRLLSNIRKQRLIRYAMTICEEYNKFADNTERLLATFMLKDDGLIWAKYRVDKQVEQANATINYFQETLKKLKQDKLLEEGKENEMSKPKESCQNNDETRLGKIEKGISEIKKQLKDTRNVLTSQFYFGLGFAAIAIAVGVWAAAITSERTDLPFLAFAIFMMGFIILFISGWQYKNRYNIKLGVSGIVTTLLGTVFILSPSYLANLNITLIPYLLVTGFLIITVGMWLMIFATFLYRK